MPLTAAEKQKKYRERLKEKNPEKFQEMKRKDSERALRHYKQKISNYTEEQKDEQRLKWREMRKKAREEAQSRQRLEQPDNSQVMNAKICRNIQRRVEYNLRRDNARLRRKLDVLSKGYNSLQKRMSRYKKTMDKMEEDYNILLKKLEIGKENFSAEDIQLEPAEEITLQPTEVTPLKRTEEFIENHLSSMETPKKQLIQNKLLEHNVLTESLKSKYNTSSNANKTILKGIIGSDIVKKYKLKTKLTKSLGLKNNYKTYRDTKKKRLELQNKIKAFYERDDVSRCSAGKKECKTFKKNKQQKRYLLDKLKNLHKKYVEEVGKVSYSTFKRYRPFYVVQQNLKDLDTCACVKHSNITFMADKLKSVGLVDTNDLNEIISLLVCDNKFKNCMYGECESCSQLVIDGDDKDLDKNVSWFAWVQKEHEYIENGHIKKKQKE